FFSPGCGPAEPISQSSAAPSIIVIEGGTLIDGTGASALSGTRILIEDGRIQEIGQRGDLSIPAGARVIEAAGKYIIPGLIDSHVHYDMPWLHRLYLANGVTTVRDLGGSIERLVTLREEISVGNLMAPRMFISGMPINPGSVRAMNLNSSREMAEKLVEAGVDGIKVTGYTTDELREIVEVAHANGLIVYGHTGPKRGNRGPGARLAIEAGLDGIEHALGILEDAMDQAVPVPADYDPSDSSHIFRYWYGRMHTVVNSTTVSELVQLMVEEDVYFAPTLNNFMRNFVQRNTPEVESDPNLKYIPEDEPDRFGRFTEEDRQEWRKTMELMMEATYKFHEAGGLLINGTDSPGAALPGWSLHQEMELFVEAGLTPMEALLATTLNNAKVLGKEDELGTIEAGKYADLIILDADPLLDISNTQEIHLVIKGGLVLYPDVLLEENLEQFGARGERHFDRHLRD
ncbi:MAG: amidohydrolase family protein, partial [Acidobacteriota bacterium]